VQACGDCHLLNFGGFATPERNIVFDINDFDETLPAPWEWDVKRLVASFVLAARSNGLSDAAGRDAAAVRVRAQLPRAPARSRRDEPAGGLVHADQRLRSSFSLTRRPADPQKRVQTPGRQGTRRTERSPTSTFPKLAEMVGGQVQIKDQPPLIFHLEAARAEVGFRDGGGQGLLAKLSRRRCPTTGARCSTAIGWSIVAMKVVGIGSVGRYCSIGLFMSSSNQPLFLQFKEAVESVLEPYVGKSGYMVIRDERVVHGPAPDAGVVRHLPRLDDRIAKATTRLRSPACVMRRSSRWSRPSTASMLVTLRQGMCGWALALAHGRASHPWLHQRATSVRARRSTRPWETFAVSLCRPDRAATMRS
jgi:hypothetical protein